MSKSDVEVIRKVYEAFGRGDMPAVLAGLDANVRFTEAEGFQAAPPPGPGASISRRRATRTGGIWV
jgi:ketosteroid isomerase-like protein